MKTFSFFFNLFMIFALVLLHTAMQSFQYLFAGKFIN